jgi:two-component system, response regulator YesN
MNIVVAEDERLALEDVLSMLRPLLGQHQVAGYASGSEVLAYTETARVDLLITDIRMPGMDGLELIGRLRGQNDDFAAIVLSGYGDFEYARAGIRLGIVDYLLKPVRTEALLKAAGAALDGLAEAREGRERTREMLLAQMLTGRAGAADDALVREACGIVVTVCENWEGQATWHAAGLDPGFTRRALAGSRQAAYEVVDLDAHCRVVLAPPDLSQQSWAERQALRVHRASLAAGVVAHTAYDCKAAGEEPASVVRQLLDRLGAEMRLELPTFLRPDQAPSRPREGLALESRERLAHALAHGRTPGPEPAALAEIRAALDGLRQVGETQPVIVQTLDDLFGMVRSSLDGEGPGDVPGRDSISSVVRASRSYKDLAAWVEEALRPVLERNRVGDTPRDLVGKLVATIDTSYWKDISLQAFAAEHGVSLAYFSRLFKDETGVTFSEYQTRVRMVKAKELLARPDIRLHQVSTLVGYGDPKYFGQIFRKVVGVSPLDYQRSQQRGRPGNRRGVGT